ncbi:hypothetical protein BD410DRAFT_526440 [Rickenella mellea]|uniref:Dipeptidylpeptidase IV N-terminal domain-containing protein n=1 Tax=Rickenella mellea TaxID=50990 RepID=A0A4Y7QFX8_9AGAM|nr:hypothetical protein BD410DRAFT_526440 [Rickenella mellea]
MLAALSDIKRWGDGATLYISEWKLSPDMKYLLVKADYKKQWRHSSFGNYYIHNIASRSTRPLIDPTYPPVTAYATWAPTGEAIAYVASNDLYIIPSPVPETAPIRITTSGNSSLFHGVPDWVYEEEVFSSDFALWWAPDASKVAFLRLDETSVPEYTYPVYNPSEDSYKVHPYTSDIAMKYPKPGYDNPLVSVHVFELHRYQERQSAGDVIGFPEEDATRMLEWEGRMMVNDSVVMDVTWVGNEGLIVKEVNRAADKGSVVFFDLNKAKNVGGRELFREVVRKLGEEGKRGRGRWVDRE